MPQADRPKAKAQDPRPTSRDIDPRAKGAGATGKAQAPAKGAGATGKAQAPAKGAGATGKSPTAARAARDDGFDPTFGIKLDPDEFFAQERRREQIIKMQDVVRPGRTTPIAVRFDQFTLRRLKTLATLHNKGYQTLLKEFVVERLYEEEKRAGIIDP
jgi:hypothetical protein